LKSSKKNVNHQKNINIMTGKDYVPRKHFDYERWSKNLVAYAEENHERWLVCAPKAIIGSSLDDFVAKNTKAMAISCTKLDITIRNEARKLSEKLLRSYVQGFIAKNPLVTVADKEAMQITVADSVPTSAGIPTGMASADIQYPGSTQLLLRIKHVEGTEFDEKANYGYRIYYGVYAPNDTPPATGKDLHLSRFTRTKKELFLFEPEDSGNKAWFCIRYENSKGKPGPWGTLFYAIIP
jgi:hypothetical protein